MARGTVTVLEFRGTCKNEHRFKLYGLSDFSYGDKTARTPDPSDFSVLNCLTDPVLDELSSMVEAVLGGYDSDDWRPPYCFEVGLSVACDPAPSGHRYDFTGKPWCPVCHVREVVFGPVIPDIWETIEVPLVTHTLWDTLTQDEKHTRLREALREAGCLT